MLKKFVVATAISAMVFMSFGVFAEDVAPDELIRKNTADVLAMLKSDKDLAAGDPVKIDKLANEKILPYFNFQRMTQLAVGRGWRDTTDVQKTALINEFRRLLVRTYSSSLSQFRNQTIDVRSLKLVPTDAEIVVKTVVNQPGGQGIPIDYAMEKTKDGWKVFDVMIDGVSLVTNYRSSFSTEIKNGGVDGLIKSLADRNAKNAAKK
ncbi:MAG: ABC transporter substrate-binding protein [Pseudomonadota bacterium]